MIRNLFIMILLLPATVVLAQENISISGTVRNAQTGETIIGATILERNSAKTTLSNAYGFYSLKAPIGPVHLIVSFAGMEMVIKDTLLSADAYLNVYLHPDTRALDSVIVSLPLPARNIRSAQMGSEKLTTRDMEYIPRLLGEKDPLKAIQLLPGIKPASEGSSGIYVRGGAADQNLILLDEAVVYNASHLLGFFSTFNADAVKDITVYKGGMPARYGGRLSSVVDIRMNDGNNREYKVNAGIGFISSRLSVQGPVQKEKSSFLLSGRTTYVDLFLKHSKDSTINRNRIGFYDLNAKLNYQIGKKDQLFLSGYFGNDHLNAGSEFGLNWGNATGTLRWNHVFNNSIFANTSLIFSDFNYEIDLNLGANKINIYSGIRDWHLKNEFQWGAGSGHTFRAGLNVNHHTIQPGNIKSSESSNFNDTTFQKRYSLESAIFLSDSWKISPIVMLELGVRLGAFTIFGRGDFYEIDPRGKISDTIHVAAGEIFKNYIHPEPRVSLSVLLSPVSSFKASYVRNVQNLHLLSNSTTSRPTDRWVASTNNILPEISDQFSIGYYLDFAGRALEFTTEAYYKDLKHQIDFRDGADLNGGEPVETQLLYGIGRSYGIEFLLRKRRGKFSGWIAYTLSKSEKKIPGINEGRWYNARQDRTHDIAIVLAYQLPKKWTLSANWVYATGDAVSFPEGKYILNNQVYYYYSGRNAYRMPDYHRMDFAISKKFKSKGSFQSELNIGLYNVYGRENAYTITFRDAGDNGNHTEVVQTSLFKFVPSINYNITF